MNQGSGLTQIRVPAKHNPRLTAMLDRAGTDLELQQFWQSANVNAVQRSGISDHGSVHVQIVANAGLRLLRLLGEAGIAPSVVSDHGLEPEDAEVIVVLGAALHDLGIAVSRDDHERYSLILAYPKARQLLAGIYEEPALTIVVAEALHAIAAHRWDVRCLTLEAGVVKVADALDMTEGRSRIPFEAGRVNIHSLSAQAIESVTIEKGSERPVRVRISMSNSAGIFQVDELLRRKLTNSTLAPYVEVVASISGESERRLIEVYKH
jgi:metal-dependent HD superfamily phosphatase/phosphodiesterase